jgi:hypothetical protein
VDNDKSGKQCNVDETVRKGKRDERKKKKEKRKK